LRAKPAAILLMGVVACAPPGAREAIVLSPGQRHALLAVPFYPDNTDQCGPSSLAGVLNFWGNKAQPAELKKEIYQTHLKGYLTVDLMLAAQARGLSAQMLEASLERLKLELDSGQPLIVFVNTGLRF